MRIDVFTRPDGTVWADFAQAARADRKVFVSLEATTRTELERLVESPGDLVPERVRALAQRALKETVEASKPKERPVDARFADVTVGERGFLGRLQWLISGR